MYEKPFEPVIIDTVVFDMGGVLVEWDPLKLASAFVEDEGDARLLAREVFGGSEWTLQDAGALSADTVAWAARRRLPPRLGDAAEAAAFHWYEHLSNLPGIGSLIRRLKREGHGVYLLSNAGTQFERYRDDLPAIECFDGMVVSAYEHVVKPDPAIYLLLCERYRIAAQTCLFVDDTEANAVAAERVGMRGYHYDGDVERLSRFLHAMGPSPQRRGR